MIAICVDVPSCCIGKGADVVRVMMGAGAFGPDRRPHGPPTVFYRRIWWLSSQGALIVVK